MDTPAQSFAPLTEQAAAKAGKYLILRIAQEVYGIRVLQVREIIRLQKITFVPEMPAYVKGAINLRGQVVPVVDLRSRFGCAGTTDTGRTCIIVVKIKCAKGGTSPLGLIVDGVEEVVQIAAADVEPTPGFGTHAAASYLMGMAKTKGQVMALLDIDEVLGSAALPAS